MSKDVKEDMRSIYERILSARKNFGEIVKDSENPFHKSKYADLNSYLHSVSDALAAEGVSLFQPLEVRPIEGRLISTVKTILICPEGYPLTSELILPDLQDPQKIGAAITYYRRYTLASLLGLAAEDDDAEGAKPQAKQSTAFKKPTDFDLGSLKALKEYLEKNSAKMPKPEYLALKSRFDELKAEYTKNKPEQQETKK